MPDAHDSTASARERLIVGLDLPDVGQASAMVETLGDDISFYKIGYQLGYAPGGLDFVRDLTRSGKQVFLDLKMHDIGNTVQKGVEAVLSLGISMLTVHAYPQTMRAAAKAASGTSLTVLGVTVMTSYDEADLREAGYAGGVRDLVLRRAAQARDCGLGGIVASAAEAADVRKVLGPQLAIVTPGIRPAGAALDDQKRAVTPGDALRDGASHLVVARPIVSASDPREAARAILAEVDAALHGSANERS